MIKLLALDIDDTLTKTSVTVSEENLAAIRRAQEAGVFVTVATGRGYFGSSSIWRAMCVQGPVINYGGAIVNDTRTGKAIHATEMAPELVSELMTLGAQLGVHAQLYQGDGVVFAGQNQYSQRYCAFLDLPHTVDADVAKKCWHNVPKVLYITEEEQARELIPQLAALYAGRLKVSGSKAGFIEFNTMDAHKGAALAWLADHMGLERKQVAAMGDNLLDLEMIQWAGLSAAVADANDEILLAADVIAPACEENGVAWFIDHHVLKGA